MKKLLAGAGFIASIGLASIAFAQGANTATLASSVPDNTSLIAGGGAWACGGTSCVLQSDPSDVDSYGSCRDLHHQLNVAVTALDVGGRSLSADLLASCNK